MDWWSLEKAIFENSNDQGLIFTFKAEIKHLVIDRLTNISDHRTYICVGHSAQNIS